MKSLRIAACAAALGLCLQSVHAASVIPGPWLCAFSDDPAYALPGFDDSGWTEVRLPAAVGAGTSGGSAYMWLRARVSLPDLAAGGTVYLLGGKEWGSAEFYINGSLIGVFGRFPPDFQYNGGLVKQALIPKGLAGGEGATVIAIRVFNEAGVFKLAAPALGSAADFETGEYVTNFWNVRVYMIFACLSFFIFLFFILQWALRRSEHPKLYFALANLCFAVYFLNMGLDSQFLPFLLFGAVSKSLLVVALAFLTWFFIEFFAIHDRRWVKAVVAVPAAGFALMFYILPKDTTTIGSLFTLSLISVVADMLFMSYIAVRALVGRSRDAVPIIFGTVIGISLGAYDVIYQASGLEPVVWLQGIGIFGFNFSMFIALSLQTIRMRKDLEASVREVAERKDQLELYIKSAGEVSSKVSGITRELEEGIVKASHSVESLSKRSQEIAETMGGQTRVVKDTQSTVMGLLGSLASVYDSLESQAREVESTSATVEHMLSGIQGVAESLKKAADFTGSLGGKTQKGGEAVTASTEAIGKVAEASESINGIVDSVTDLAKQTDLLAMNAAIEAAHAGEFGRGFAVVASEIRSLAEASTQRSKEITALITDIGQRIGEGVRVNEEARGVLLDIARNTDSAIAQVQDVYRSISEQREASRRIKESLASLMAATARIRGQTDTQREGGDAIKTMMDALVRSSDEVLASVRAISEENGRIVDLISTIRATSAGSREVIARMNGLLQGGIGA